MTTAMMHTGSSSLPARISRGLRWRMDALRHRVKGALPRFVPVLRELRVATGRGSIAVASDLVMAWRQLGCSPVIFAELCLWEAPTARWDDFFVEPELNPFMQRTLSPADRALSRDKAAFAEVGRKRGVPWLPTLAVVNRREGPAIEGAAVVARVEDLAPTLASLTASGPVVLKPSCGQRGAGFYLVSPDGRALDGDGHEIDAGALAQSAFRYTHRHGNFGYVVQPALRPHPDIVALTGVDALTTVRVVTALSRGVPHVIESHLKIPAPGKLTDNFRDGTTGTMAAGVDPDDGTLTELIGILRPGNRYILERTVAHPVTGRHVAGAKLPFAREIIDLAFRAALAHPDTATLGWDVAIAERGLFILDGNPNWGPAWKPCSPVGPRALLSRLYPDSFHPPRP
jgi:hypothetical protein